MPNEILALLDADSSEDQIMQVATAVADLLHAQVRTLSVDVESVHATAEALAALTDPHVAGCVLAAGADPNGMSWRIVAVADKPVVLVPAKSRLPHPRITRALLPLDGTPESALAVSRTAQLLDRAGVELVVLHVFDAATVPSFWDQRAHAHRAWTTEFLSRCGAPSSARLELRSGRPGEHVVRAADTEHVDLIALGWSRNIQPGRAQTVRESILSASVPVLLLPIVPD